MSYLLIKQSSKIIKSAIIFGMLLLIFSLSFNLVQAQSPVTVEYISPQPNAMLVNPETTIAIRQGGLINEAGLKADLFEVTAEKSGHHPGKVVLADDDKTVIFVPDTPFTPNETVLVTFKPGLQTVSGQTITAQTFQFTIAPQTNIRLVSEDWVEKDFALPFKKTITGSGVIYPPTQYMTLPPDYPTLTVTVAVSDTADGYIFLSSFHQQWLEANPYLLILDDMGDPVYYQKMTPTKPTIDFKKQPNGLLTYADTDTNLFYAMDNSYTIVATYTAGNGYTPDFHDLLLLDDDHYLLFIYDRVPYDMSQVVEGGNPEAIVTGIIIQELDRSNNVVFEWRSWDYLDQIEFSDTVIDLTGINVDYIHTNGIALDTDGHILISNRHLSDIIKINHQTGEIMWRWGGKKNEFTFIDDPENGFAIQHDVRRLPNGNITLFNNRYGDYSKAMEYQLDEVNKTATLIWEYASDMGAYAFIMGNAQRLPNGNTFINWASTFPTITEVKPDGREVFELTLAEPLYTYRAFRFPWEGYPTTQPMLVATSKTPTITLYYSWNGATEISAYRVYGGQSPQPTTLLATQPKTGFETMSVFTNIVERPYYFRVMPVDKNGLETTYSNEVLLGSHLIYLPLILRD